jgi:hypothetical protein
MKGNEEEGPAASGSFTANGPTRVAGCTFWGYRALIITKPKVLRTLGTTVDAVAVVVPSQTNR